MGLTPRFALIKGKEKQEIASVDFPSREIWAHPAASRQDRAIRSNSSAPLRGSCGISASIPCARFAHNPSGPAAHARTARAVTRINA